MLLTAGDLDEFDIDRFIDKLLGLDETEMLLRCLNFAILVQGIKLIPAEPGHNKEIVINFTRFIKHLQIILTKNKDAEKPIGMSNEAFFKVKPIVEKLVASTYFKKEWLELYKPIF